MTLDISSFKTSPVRATELELQALDRFGVQLSLLRLDQIHPWISGNKWFKLLPQLKETGSDTPLLSFGGPHSNHLHALGWAGQQLGLSVIAVVRGSDQSTPMLEDLRRWGVRVHFVDRECYRQRTDPDLINALHQQFGAFHLIPEGGSNRLAVNGCAAIWSLDSLQELPRPDILVTAVGSGGTLAGLALGAPVGVWLEGVSVFKDLADLNERVTGLLGSEDPKNWSLASALPLRYGKINAELSALLQHFNRLTGVELDAIYTVRVLHFILRKLISGGYPPGSRIWMVHTGGVQGNRAQSERVSRLASAFCGPLSL